jgi:hypothetical protein
VDFLIKHEKKPHVKLIKLIESNSSIEAEKQIIEKINLIHSILGALRNLCISGKLKIGIETFINGFDTFTS